MLVCTLILSFIVSSECSCHVEFLSVGDFGEVNPNSSHVGYLMGLYANTHDLSFITALGGNFYPGGVTGTEDSQWDDTFNTLFPEASLDVPWYNVLGDTDYLGTEGAQIEYTVVDPRERWNMPGLYYDLIVGPVNGTVHPDDREGCEGMSVHMIFIDTQILAPDTSDIGDSPYDLSIEALAQLEWLRETLEASVSEWIVVVGHYPIYSSGESGPVNTVLQDSLTGLFDEYRVDAYISGHDYSMQHIVTTASWEYTQYYINAAAAFTGMLYDQEAEYDVNYATASGMGYMSHVIDLLEGTMTTNFHSESETVYTAVQTVTDKTPFVAGPNSAVKTIIIVVALVIVALVIFMIWYVRRGCPCINAIRIKRETARFDALQTGVQARSQLPRAGSSVRVSRGSISDNDTWSPRSLRAVSAASDEGVEMAEMQPKPKKKKDKKKKKKHKDKAASNKDSESAKVAEAEKEYREKLSQRFGGSSGPPPPVSIDAFRNADDDSDGDGMTIDLDSSSDEMDIANL